MSRKLTTHPLLRRASARSFPTPAAAVQDGLMTARLVLLAAIVAQHIFFSGRWSTELATTKGPRRMPSLQWLSCRQSRLTSLFVVWKDVNAFVKSPTTPHRASSSLSWRTARATLSRCLQHRLALLVAHHHHHHHRHHLWTSPMDDSNMHPGAGEWMWPQGLEATQARDANRKRCPKRKIYAVARARSHSEGECQ